MINIKDDSRNVVAGDIFIALRGVGSDGHQYIEEAIKNGAAKIIAEVGSYSIETLIVPNTRDYLIDYLKNTYADILKSMHFIGITGTNGKTTCAFILHNALNKLGQKTAYIGTIGFFIVDKVRSINNTTPDLIALYNMIVEAYEQGCINLVMEVSSHGLAYQRVDGILFDYVAFTNLTQDHLDFHKTMENYALAKQLLFKKLTKTGKALINVDDGYKDYFLLPENHNITYGLKSGDYQIVDPVMTNQQTMFTYKYQTEAYQTSTVLLGEYNLYNLLLVIALLHEMGYADISKLIPELKAPKGRMDVIPVGTNSIIIDYAHTPDALRKVLATLKTVTSGRIYTLLGCDGDRDRTKRPIMVKIAMEIADQVILTDQDPHTEDPDQIINDMLQGVAGTNYVLIRGRAEAIKEGISLLDSHDLFLIPGKGHEEVMYLKEGKVPYSDYQEVDKCLKER